MAELSSSGSLVTAVPNPPGGTPEPIAGLALDANANIWGVVPNFDSVIGGSPFVEFSNTGAAIVPPGVGQFSCGASPVSDYGPLSMALDAAGNVWFTGGQGVTKESKSPIPDCSGTGGGIEGFIENSGGDIAIDGDGNVWVVNATGPFVLAELANSGAPISPSTGYEAPGAALTCIALDGSGNLWAKGTNFTIVDSFYYSLNILEYIGVSAPVVTPISAGVKNNTLGSRP